uniref:SJCHGC09524 protein n=1 Tax=Schistosoma japonicum TaxID=6182 RepID=Q5DEK3_SCHJA|nr:SJCHGC09524 protein [Schistosoma japonicum]
MKEFGTETYVIIGHLRNFSIRVKLFHRQTKAEEQHFEEEYVFHWQEKVFSPREKIFYRDQKNCKTETQLLYNKEIKNTRFCQIFLGGNGSISYPEKQRSKIQTKPGDLTNHLPPDELLLESAPEYLRHFNHLPTIITQDMYIMADLSDSIPGDVAELSSPYVGNEEILCKITIGSDGLLHCKPDFTHGGR